MANWANKQKTAVTYGQRKLQQRVYWAAITSSGDM